MSSKKKEKGKVHELTDIGTQFVSLVSAGANRQSKFMVVKTDSQQDNEENEPEGEPSTSNQKGDVENPPEADLSGWLDEAGSAIDSAMLDAKFEENLATNDEEGSVPNEGPKKTGEVGTGEQPAPDISLVPDEEEDSESLAEAEEVKAEASKLRKALKAEKLKVAKMRQSVIGGTSALMTGEVGVSTKGGEDKEIPKRTEWGSGKDLASV